MPSDFEHDNDEEEIIYVSKSQLKRESNALQALGEELVDLPAAKLERIPLPQELAEAVALAQRIKARGGRKRQLQYIGKLMRRLDEAPIRQAMDQLKGESARKTAHLHKVERWRERLLDEGDSALAELLEEYPTADRQHLRQLMRNAQREKKQNKPPKSARELFRSLRDLMAE